jgi:hypothetical protein
VVVNTTRGEFRNLKATLDVYDMAGRRLSGKSVTLKTVAANSTALCFEGAIETAEAAHIVRLTLRRGTEVLSLNDYVMAGSESGNLHELVLLEKSTLSARVVKGGFEVSNSSKPVAVAVKLNLRDAAGKRILPAYFSDGYFNLLPGEKRIIEVEVPAEAAFISAEGFNVEKTNLIKL